MKRNRFLKILKFAPIAVVLVTLLTAGFSYVVMRLWNWLVPAIFGLHLITYWQAVGILILSKILFGGFRGGRGGWNWRRRMRERWEQMTPEERERFRQGLKSFRDPFGSAPKPNK
jgi:Ca2+/H+ antiporter, TMEM165/GDT1 family